MALSLEQKVEKFAIFSRIAVIILQVIFNALIPDYPDPTTFNPPKLPESKTIWDRVVVFLFGGYRHWDATYFLHIAEYGYTYEKCLAFFPLFPWITRTIANSLFYPLQVILAYHNTLLLSAALINFFLFIKSAKILFQLGGKVMQDKTLAYKAALLYCINPASIFFSAPYSETLFAFLCFSGMLYLEKSSSISAAPFFGLAALTRSNGLVTVAFIAYDRFKFLVASIQTLVRNRMNDLAPFLGGLSTICAISVAPLFACSLLFILPFATFQVYIFKIFCRQKIRKDSTNYTVPPHIIKYGQDMGDDFKFPWDGPFPWCKQWPPISYSYIQSHYWDVGFLKYYTFNNIPNFILALPIVILCCCAAKEYYDKNKKYVLTLGLNAELNDPAARQKKDDDAIKRTNATGYFSHRCFVYITHMVALMSLGVPFIHIQVITRFLCSSCPVIYWYAAMVMTPGQEPGDLYNEYDVMNRAKNERPVETAKNVERKLDNLLTDQILNFRQNNCSSKIILLYFLTYFIVGTLLFCNSLPWT